MSRLNDLNISRRTSIQDLVFECTLLLDRYLYDTSRTLDNDFLDEWGTVHEKVIHLLYPPLPCLSLIGGKVDLVRGSTGLVDNHAEVIL